MLEPEIYVVNGKNASKKSNPETFLSTRAKIQSDEKDEDDVNNLLLKSSPEAEEMEAVRNALEYIENIEEGTIQSANDDYDIRYVTSDIAKACFRNNIHEFDIHLHEDIVDVSKMYCLTPEYISII